MDQYYESVNAFYAGTTFDCCPYDEGSIEGYEWEMGWCAAHREAKEQESDGY